ncbi:MAG: rane protein of unknown function [Candidatus Saccharibacteria bacterium]|nr:rane protein of unknown function [Candidatus Saccharibacteria bacterium]
MQKRNDLYYRIIGVGSSIILVLLPFHALFTTFFASHFAHFDLIRIWKEILLLGLCIVAIIILFKDLTLLKKSIKNRVVQAGILYLTAIAIATIYGLLVGNVNRNAAIYGFIIDTRYVLFLGVVSLAAHRYRFHWEKLVFIPAILVIIFSILQMTILPKEFLAHFGYGRNTIPLFETIDGKQSFFRVQSTLRGPNAFGAYMMLICTLLFAEVIKTRKKRIYVYITSAASLIALYGSYSRGAWIGLMVSLVCFSLWSIQDPTKKKQVYIVTALAVLFVGIVTVSLRNNDIAQNMLFHTNEKSTSLQSSNEQHSSALKSGVKDIYNTPLGKGVGSAGPASLRNTKMSRIAENYFLQIGQEAGLIGLGLFMLFIAMLGKSLWDKHTEVLPRAVLAILVGTIFINMLTHAWADDTLAYVFFGMAGIAIVGTSTKSKKILKYSIKKPVN